MADLWKALRKALSGKKTHLIGLIVVIIAVTEGLLGVDVPGFTVGADWLEWALGGSGLMSVRAALDKIGVRGA